MTASSTSDLVPIDTAPITMQTLRLLAKGPTVPERYKDKPNDLLAAVLYGREIGLPPMQAIHQVYLVDGNASLKGVAMSAVVHGAGHELRVKTSIKGAKVTAMRRDPYTHELSEVGEISFGPEDAETAKLAGKDAWKKYPQAMYAWRAMTLACRLFFGDVLAGMGYTPEEIDADDEIEPLPEGAAIVTDLDDDSPIIDVEEVAEALDADDMGEYEDQNHPARQG